MLIRSVAPLRLGLAGGGTDVSPYCDIYGGAVLNATISLYAYATIEPRNDGKIEIISVDRNESMIMDSKPELEIDGKLDLIKGVYNRIVKDFNKGEPLSFTIYTYADAPPGSGLGTSSTLVVAVIGAFAEWLKLQALYSYIAYNYSAVLSARVYSRIIGQNHRRTLWGI